MTANNPEKLDKAFLRPGRIDRKFELPNATKEQVEKLFIKFFGADQCEAAQILGAMLPTSRLSMARLQQHFVEYMEDQGGVISNINKLLVNEITKKYADTIPTKFGEDADAIL
jgi:chaperone BCS1